MINVDLKETAQRAGLLLTGALICLFLALPAAAQQRASRALAKEQAGGARPGKMAAANARNSQLLEVGVVHARREYNVLTRSEGLTAQQLAHIGVIGRRDAALRQLLLHCPHRATAGTLARALAELVLHAWSARRREHGAHPPGCARHDSAH